MSQPLGLGIAGAGMAALQVLPHLAALAGRISLAAGRREIAVEPHRGRSSELIELHEAVTNDRATLLDARWGMASTEICLAILESARERRDILLLHQVALPAQEARRAAQH
ncbi:MAG: hypothetical protein EXR29_10795 [Betaproteobacteria bacterium]|nr:hypothetical protein [Betaproteobacteria bacterium]